jgi:hypothetical protein
LSLAPSSPKFNSNTDLRLLDHSVCKDSGNPLPIFNDLDGSRNDQGAYGGPFGGWYYYFREE